MRNAARRSRRNRTAHRPQATGRAGIKRPLKYNLLLRSRKTIGLDLKDPQALETVLQLVEQADALIEGFRPGVTERLGLGPDACLARNPRLVYGRMTGWGQSGPLAMTAGHDLGYIAITGVLNAIGRKNQPPTMPLNLLGDYGGGALYLALGICAAIIEAQRSGKGQVVDAAIVDGTASLATTFFGMHAAGMLSAQRGSNMTDSGSHFYDVYECRDGGWLAVGPIESKFYDTVSAAARALTRQNSVRRTIRPRGPGEASHRHTNQDQSPAMSGRKLLRAHGCLRCARVALVRGARARASESAWHLR